MTEKNDHRILIYIRKRNDHENASGKILIQYVRDYFPKNISNLVDMMLARRFILIIQHLVFRNFRKYETARFNFHEQFNVLFGNNGAGKTTVLDALAIMLNTYFQGSRIPTGGGIIKKNDARLLITQKSGQIFREPQDEVTLEATASLSLQPITWLRKLGDRGRDARDFIQIGTDERARIRIGESPNLPLLLYYGAGRLWDVHQDMQIEAPLSQLDAYRYCLDPKSDQKSFEKWFKKISLSALQRSTIREPAIETVKNAVLTCTPGSSDFFYDIAKDQILIRLEREGLVPFDYLSNGYRNMVAMVADIAHRASRLNPHLGDQAARETRGIVLIDEIDLHLHPKWQRRVVIDLRRAFPNLQFITTTHSPFILQSLTPGERINMDRIHAGPLEGAPVNNDVAPNNVTEATVLSIEDIAEELMGVDMPQRSQRYQEMHQAAVEYYLVLREARNDTSQTETLKQRLDELSAPFSDDMAYHAFLEMERSAAGLGASETETRKNHATGE